MQKKIKQSSLDTTESVICDYTWKPKLEIVPAIKPIKIDMNIISMNIAKMKNKGLENSSNNDKKSSFSLK